VFADGTAICNRNGSAEKHGDHRSSLGVKSPRISVISVIFVISMIVK
jgi:hypothetical protein